MKCLLAKTHTFVAKEILILSTFMAQASIFGYVELDYPLGPREQADAYMRKITEIGEKVFKRRD